MKLNITFHYSLKLKTGESLRNAFRIPMFKILIFLNRIANCNINTAICFGSTIQDNRKKVTSL